MQKRIHIIGAGSIGGLIGSRLTKKYGKENIMLIDTDTEHVRSARDKGLRIYDKGQKKPRMETIDVNIITPDQIDKSKLKTVILATKSYSNQQALDGLNKETSILVLQNGFDERLSAYPNVVTGVEFGFACKVAEPAFIFNAVKGKYVLGSSKGVNTRVINWAAILNEAQIKAETKENIDGYLWSKLLINSALNPVSAINRMSFKNLIETDKARQLFKALYVEGYPIVKIKADQLNQKLGNFIGPPNVASWLFSKRRLSDFVLKGIAGKFGEVESSMLQDIRRNRPTEIDFINGAIINLAKEYGIETPNNDRIYKQIKKLEPE